MEITWYGLSCFRLREGGVTVVCDPFDKSVGLTLPRIRADIVTVSHDQPGHNAVSRVTGEPKVISGPGEYEVKNVFVTGLTTYHKNGGAARPERNIAYFFDFDGFIVGHLGDLGQVPSQTQVEEVGDIDVLFVPVGGGDVLEASRAAEVIGLLEPRILIPMHYQHPGLDPELAAKLDPVEKFLKELGITDPERLESLKITKSSLPEETQIMILLPSTVG